MMSLPTIAVCASAKNEAAYLEEWVAHYLHLGFSKIFVYDNDSEDDPASRLRAYIDAGVVRLIPWPTQPGLSPQISAWQDFLLHRASEYEFVAFFDIDEFLFLDDAFRGSARRFLANLPPQAGAVAINQRVFGSSGQIKAEAKDVTSRFRRCSEPMDSENQWIKTIARPSAIRSVVDCHAFRLREGFSYFTSAYIEISGKDVAPRTVEIPSGGTKVQLNHYILKSAEEFDLKKSRGGGAAAEQADRLRRYSDEAFFSSRDARANAVEFEGVSDLQAGIARTRRAFAGSAAAGPQDVRTVPQSPHMPEACVKALGRYLQDCGTFIEYGAGGSSLFAARSGTPQIISVDTDRRWSDSVEAEIDRRFPNTSFHKCFVDVGPVGEWGYPLGTSHKENYFQLCMAPWLLAAQLSRGTQLVLIDGRFRLASFLTSLAFAQQGTFILFDDYVGRNYYGVAEKYLSRIEVVDRMVIFRKDRSVLRADLLSDVFKYVKDSR